MSELLESLRLQLPSPEEREILTLAIAELKDTPPPARRGPPTPPSVLDGIVNEMAMILRSLEVDPNALEVEVRRVDGLIKRSDAWSDLPTLWFALRLQRLIIRIAPVFARHSLTKLCAESALAPEDSSP